MIIKNAPNEDVVGTGAGVGGTVFVGVSVTVGGILNVAVAVGVSVGAIVGVGVTATGPQNPAYSVKFVDSDFPIADD